MELTICAPCHFGLESGVIPSKQLCQERIVQAVPDMEIILLSELAEFVPWAAELAVITAVNTIAYEGSKF